MWRQTLHVCSGLSTRCSWKVSFTFRTLYPAGVASNSWIWKFIRTWGWREKSLPLTGTELPLFSYPSWLDDRRRHCVKLIPKVTNMLEEELNVIFLNLGKYQDSVYKIHTEEPWECTFNSRLMWFGHAVKLNTVYYRVKSSVEWLTSWRRNTENRASFF